MRLQRRPVAMRASTRVLSRVATRPLHPLMAAALPVLILFASNRDQVLDRSTLVFPLAVVLAAGAIMWAVAWAAVRDVRRAALVTSVLTLVFFAYGHVWNLTYGRALGPLALTRTSALIGWAAASVGAVILALRVRRPARMTVALNVVSVALVGANLAPVATARAPRPHHVAGARTPLVAPAAEPRDIYYLIFDRYAAADTLRRDFAFDNSCFVGWLREHGFTLPSRSLANYARTGLSLASSLNLTYLDDLKSSERTSDWRPAYDRLRNTEVTRVLGSLGYRSVRVGSGFEATDTDPGADINLRYGDRSEFSSVLYHLTPIPDIAAALGAHPPLLDARRYKAELVRYQFDKIAQTRKLAGPVFVFAHILLPHDPYIFDRDGRILSDAEDRERPMERKYLDQLSYTNLLIESLVTRLQRGPERERPIVILQSDEGPDPKRVRDNDLSFDWRNGTTDELLQKFRILNAYSMPGLDETGIYPSITPANTFRLLLRRYFGSSIPLLPDRSYQIADTDHIYDFVDVTKRLRKGSK